MRSIMLALLMVGFLFLGAGSFVFAEESSADTQAAAEVMQPVDVGNQICPVSGEKIDPAAKATYEYKGKIYNFCCPMCIEEFKKDPEEYIKKIEAEKQEESTGSAEGEEETGMMEMEQQQAK